MKYSAQLDNHLKSALLGAFGFSGDVTIFPDRHDSWEDIGRTNVHELAHRDIAQLTTFGIVQCTLGQSISKSLPPRAGSAPWMNDPELAAEILTLTLTVSRSAHEGWATARELHACRAIGLPTPSLSKPYRKASIPFFNVVNALPKDLMGLEFTVARVLAESTFSTHLFERALNLHDLASWSDYLREPEETPDFRLLKLSNRLAEAIAKLDLWQLAREAWKATGNGDPSMERAAFTTRIDSLFFGSNAEDWLAFQQFDYRSGCLLSEALKATSNDISFLAPEHVSEQIENWTRDWWSVPRRVFNPLEPNPASRQLPRGVAEDLTINWSQDIANRSETFSFRGKLNSRGLAPLVVAPYHYLTVITSDSIVLMPMVPLSLNGETPPDPYHWAVQSQDDSVLFGSDASIDFHHDVPTLKEYLGNPKQNYPRLDSLWSEYNGHARGPLWGRPWKWAWTFERLVIDATGAETLQAMRQIRYRSATVAFDFSFFDVPSMKLTREGERLRRRCRRQRASLIAPPFVGRHLLGFLRLLMDSYSVVAVLNIYSNPLEATYCILLRSDAQIILRASRRFVDHLSEADSELSDWWESHVTTSTEPEHFRSPALEAARIAVAIRSGMLPVA